MVNTLISFIAILALCVFLAARCKVNAALTPLLALSIAMVLFTLAGVAGYLVLGGWLFCGLSLGLCIDCVLKIGVKKSFAALCTPGFFLFLGGSVLVLVLLAVKQPVFSMWDEFSTWGTATKLTRLYGALYPTAPTGLEWTMTEMPGLVLLGWFMQIWGDFAPWKCFFAYDMLLLACFAAALAPFEKKRALSVGLALCCALLPFFFLVPHRDTGLATVYMSAYADLPAGVMFGGAVVFYGARRAEGKCPLPALLPLAAAALMKDNTLPLALVAAGLAFFDTLFFVKADRKRKTWALQKGGLMASFFAAPVGMYLVWKGYTAWANGLNPATGGGETGVGPLTAVLQTTGQLVGATPATPRFEKALEEMPLAFLDGTGFPASMLGSGLATLLLILAIFTLAVVLAQGRHNKWRVGAVGLLSTGGFLGYQYVLFITYAAITKYPDGVPDYNRYSTSYYAGWLLVALFCLALGTRQKADGLTPVEARPALAAQKRALAAQSGVLVLALAACIGFGGKVLPNTTLLDYPSRLQADRRAEQATAEALADKMELDGRAFFVTSNDTGGKWFRYHYYLLPRILDYSEGGNVGPPKKNTGDYYVAFTLEEFDAYLVEHGCDYILLEQNASRFRKTYKTLFSDGLKAWEGKPLLYRRGDDGLFHLVA